MASRLGSMRQNFRPARRRNVTHRWNVLQRGVRRRRAVALSAATGRPRPLAAEPPRGRRLWRGQRVEVKVLLLKHMHVVQPPGLHSPLTRKARHLEPRRAEGAQQRPHLLWREQASPSVLAEDRRAFTRASNLCAPRHKGNGRTRPAAAERREDHPEVLAPPARLDDINLIMLPPDQCAAGIDGERAVWILARRALHRRTCLLWCAPHPSSPLRRSPWRCAACAGRNHASGAASSPESAPSRASPS